MQNALQSEVILRHHREETARIVQRLQWRRIPVNRKPRPRPLGPTASE